MVFHTPFQCSTTQPPNVRSITHDIKPFSNNLLFQYTISPCFEIEAHSNSNNHLLENIWILIFIISDTKHLKQPISEAF